MPVSWQSPPNLPGSLSLCLPHCEWRETQRERQRLQSWAENTLSRKSNNVQSTSCGKHTDGFLSGYFHMPFFILHIKCYFNMLRKGSPGFSFSISIKLIFSFIFEMPLKKKKNPQQPFCTSFVLSNENLTCARGLWSAEALCRIDRMSNIRF